MYDLYYRTQEGVVFVGVVVQSDGAGAIDIFNVGSVNADQINTSVNTNANANSNSDGNVNTNTYTNTNNMISKADRVLSGN